MFQLYEFILNFIRKVIPIDEISVFFEKMNLNGGDLNKIFLKISIYSIAFIIIYFLLLVIGVITSHLIDLEVVKYVEKLFLKIPLAKPIYVTLKQIREMLFSKK